MFLVSAVGIRLPFFSHRAGEQQGFCTRSPFQTLCNEAQCCPVFRGRDTLVQSHVAVKQWSWVQTQAANLRAHAACLFPLFRPCHAHHTQCGLECPLGPPGPVSDAYSWPGHSACQHGATAWCPVKASSGHRPRRLVSRFQDPTPYGHRPGPSCPG